LRWNVKNGHEPVIQTVCDSEPEISLMYIKEGKEFEFAAL
jgi:hypothetical protein